MLLICLLLIGLIAVVTNSGVEKTELVPVPVRVNETQNRERQYLRRQDMQFKLIYFLTEELKIPAQSVNLALRQIPQTPEQLPMMLWQYGLISLKQLELLWDWQKVAQCLKSNRTCSLVFPPVVNYCRLLEFFGMAGSIG